MFRLFTFFCLFFPSVLSLAVYDALEDSEAARNYSLYYILIKYGVFCTINNIISIVIFELLFPIEYTASYGQLNDAFLSQRYLLLVSGVSILTALIAKFFRKYMQFKVKISVEEQEKKK